MQENVVLVNHKQVYAIPCIASAYVQVLCLEWSSKMDDEGTTPQVVDNMLRMLMCCLKFLSLGYITVGILDEENLLCYDLVTKGVAVVAIQLVCWVNDLLDMNCGCGFSHYVLRFKKRDTNPYLRAIVITPPDLIHHFLGNSHESFCFSKVNIQGDFYGEYITGIYPYIFVGDIISNFIMAHTNDFFGLAFGLTLVSLGFAKLVDNVLTDKHPMEPMIPNVLLLMIVVVMVAEIHLYQWHMLGVEEKDSMDKINAFKYTICFYVHMVIFEWYSTILIKKLCFFSLVLTRETL